MTGQGMTEVRVMPDTAPFVRGMQRAAEAAGRMVAAAANAICALGRVLNVPASTWPQESRVESARRRRGGPDDADPGQAQSPPQPQTGGGRMTSITHELKVPPPYFDAMASGAKPFDVRRNDRAYQKGDVLRLREWHPDQTTSIRPCTVAGCGHWVASSGHWSPREPIEVAITYVYSGDPRFGGIEPGFVVLGLGPVPE